MPPEGRTSTQVNDAFPGSIECIAGADSPAVYIVTNIPGSGPEAEPEIAGGQHWHTDIEFEPIPLSTSMFYVQTVPTTRGHGDGTWVTNPPREPGFDHPDSAPELSERRENLPLNGETAYTDTAAAYAALSAEEQVELDQVVWASRGKRIAPVEVDGISDDESRAYLDRLENHCLQPEFRYDHVHPS